MYRFKIAMPGEEEFRTDMWNEALEHAKSLMENGSWDYIIILKNEQGTGAYHKYAIVNRYGLSKVYM